MIEDSREILLFGLGKSGKSPKAGVSHREGKANRKKKIPDLRDTCLHNEEKKMNLDLLGSVDPLKVFSFHEK